ncbi:MAG: Uma2 family endonuclease [Janthinobacterium lividum]
MALAQQYIEKENYTEAEYFEFERMSFGRWEYDNGKIRLMASGSDDHGTIATNIGATLRTALLPRGCRVYVEGIKVHTGDDVNTFPDVSVVCGPRIYHGGRTDVIINPLLLVEVLSPSTRDYDQREKFQHYQTIESLQDYLMVEPDKARAMLYTRREDHWEFYEVNGLESAVLLSSVGVALALSDIYALIEFEDE